MNGTSVLLFRLGYSIETRYGVLQEIAQAVKEGTPIPLAMGHTSVIWQRDVAEYAIRSFKLATSPARKLNITGPEIVSIRRLAERFGEKLGRPRSSRARRPARVRHGRRGPPGRVRLPLHNAGADDRLRRGVGGQDEPTIGKPTKFQVRDGAF